MDALSEFKNATLVAAVGLAVSFGVLQTGCIGTDQQLALSVGNAATAALLLDMAEQNRRPNTQNHRSYLKKMNFIENDAQASFAKATVLDTTLLAEKYKMSASGAEKLVSALEAAQNASDDATARSAFASIGIDFNEIKSAALDIEISEPSVAMILGISRTLEQDPKETAKMLDRLIEVMRLQQINRDRVANRETSKI